MEAISLLGMLSWCSVDDIRYKKVSVIVIVMAGIVGVCCHLYYGRLSIWEMLGGAAIGGVMLVVSILSKGKIGKGDALMLTVTGIYLGILLNLALLWLSSIMVAIFGFFATLTKGKGRKFEIPLAPFLLISYVILLFMCGGYLEA